MKTQRLTSMQVIEFNKVESNSTKLYQYFIKFRLPEMREKQPIAWSLEGFYLYGKKLDKKFIIELRDEYQPIGTEQKEEENYYTYNYTFLDDISTKDIYKVYNDLDYKKIEKVFNDQQVPIENKKSLKKFLLKLDFDDGAIKMTTLDAESFCENMKGGD